VRITYQMTYTESRTFPDGYTVRYYADGEWGEEMIRDMLRRMRDRYKCEFEIDVTREPNISVRVVNAETGQAGWTDGERTDLSATYLEEVQ